MPIAGGPGLSTVSSPRNGVAGGAGWGRGGLADSALRLRLLCTDSCLSVAVLNVIWVVPRDNPPPSPRICVRTGKSGCVALGTVQDT